MAKFQKRHYELIAWVLSTKKPDDFHTAKYTWRGIMNHFATLLQEDNPNFDVKKFHEACGFDGKYD